MTDEIKPHSFVLVGGVAGLGSGRPSGLLTSGAVVAPSTSISAVVMADAEGVAAFVLAHDTASKTTVCRSKHDSCVARALCKPRCALYFF
jgi:hypothetical protein